MVPDKNKFDPTRNRQDKHPVTHGNGKTQEGAALVHSKPLRELPRQVTVHKKLQGLATPFLNFPRELQKLGVETLGKLYDDFLFMSRLRRRRAAVFP